MDPITWLVFLCGLFISGCWAWVNWPENLTSLELEVVTRLHKHEPNCYMLNCHPEERHIHLFANYRARVPSSLGLEYEDYLRIVYAQGTYHIKLR